MSKLFKNNQILGIVYRIKQLYNSIRKIFLTLLHFVGASRKQIKQ